MDKPKSKLINNTRKTPVSSLATPADEIARSEGKAMATDFNIVGEDQKPCLFKCEHPEKSLKGVNAFIIPEELPTLLSVIYSNIPPIKLGFDTRFGFGFRIGPHADFQTIIELGPQENTQSIGTGNETVAKRHSRTRGTLEEFGEYNKIANENIQNDRREDAVIQPNLADIILGRKRKKQAKPYFDEIEFKKVSGIDDAKKNPKTSKSAKLKGEKSPNRILVSR